MNNMNLWRNATPTSGILRGLSYAASWGDFNGDSYPDVWVNYHFSRPGILYVNQKNGKFRDVTSSVFTTEPRGDQHGTAWVDIDNDGDQDLFNTVGGGSPTGTAGSNQAYINNNGILEESAVALGIDYRLARGRSLLFFDYDNDGLLDFFSGAIARRETNLSFPPTVFRQRPNGTFVEASASSGFQLDDSPYFFLSDLSGDGKLDLIAKTKNTPFPFTVYDTTSTPFRDISSSVFSSSVLSGQVASADFNNDLRPDLFITRRAGGANDFRKSDQDSLTLKLFARESEKGISFDTNGRVTFDIFPTDNAFSLDVSEVFIGSRGMNPTDFKFTLNPNDPNVQGIRPHTAGVDRGIYVGYDNTQQRWTLLLSSTNQADLENNILTKNSLAALIDSTTPISNARSIRFRSNQAPQPDQLLLNTPQGLVDRTSNSGLRDLRGESVVAGDFDNDMDQDLYVVTTRSVFNTPNVFYENQGDGTFVEVPDAGGAKGTVKGEGDFVSAVDYDLNGFLDLFIGNAPAAPTPLNTDVPYQLFQNQGNGNNWIQLDLRGRTSNRDGIGSQIFATAGGVTQLREQNGGIIDEIQSDKRIHFGLAKNNLVRELKINWVSGQVQKIRNVPANLLFNVIEPGFGNDESIRGDDRNDIISTRKGDDTLEGENGNDILTSSLGDDLLNGGLGNDSIFGHGGRDTLIGAAGGDFLNGGAGIDRMQGGLGNDRYIVDSPNDRVLEAANRGNDTVLSRISYILSNNIENLNLIGNNNIDGTANDGNNNLKGNNANNNLNSLLGNDVLLGLAGNDTLRGFGGNDFLDGGAGADRMQGGFGRDRYIVDNIGDQVLEVANGDIDSVISSVSFTLPDHVENLTFSGTTNINGTGNNLDNRIVGNSGDNNLRGFGGDDTIFAKNGNDVIKSGGGDDLIFANPGNDILVGQDGNDNLFAGLGDDTLIGSNGDDTLTGGEGADFYRFNNLNEGIDRINGYFVPSDSILIRRSGFGGGLTKGTLNANQFTLGTSATSSSHRFIYNSSNGDLFYDSDGNGANAEIQIASLASGLNLTNEDFIVI